jgi:hypothetical protein
MDLNLLSRTSSNIAISTLGTAIIYNILNVNATQPGLTPTLLNSAALEIFIASLLDDLLVARATKQMIIYQNYTSVSVSSLFPAAVIGTSPFHYAQLAISIVLAGIYITEAIRTHFWAALPRFNFVETASLAHAALRPGEKIRWTGAGLHPATKVDATRLEAFYDRDGDPRLRYQYYAEAANEFWRDGVSSKGPYTSLRGVDSL